MIIWARKNSIFIIEVLHDQYNDKRLILADYG